MQPAEAQQFPGLAKPLVALLLEAIGAVAAVMLLSRIFGGRWVLLRPFDWILLGVSGLCIVGFLMSVTAMYQRARELALLGIWLGILTSIAAATCGALVLAVSLELYGARPADEMLVETQRIMNELDADLQRLFNELGRLPTTEEADRVIAGREDAWGNVLRYEIKNELAYVLISAGPDETFGDGDDLRKEY